MLVSSLQPSRSLPNPRNPRCSAASAPSVPSTAASTIADEKKYILQTYGRPDVVFTKGQGALMWDTDGNQFLDFSSGIAVNALGHSDPRWLAALTEQAHKLAHTSNLYHTEPQVHLAKRLVDATPWADRIFYANTGTEANEACIKFARKAAKIAAGVDPYDPVSAAGAASEIVSFTGSFHGRTMGALALTYKDQYKTPFLPLMPGTVMLPYKNMEAATNAIKKGKTAAVFVEPVQGEGGIHPAGAEFLQALRTLCDEAGAALIFDEVQCGLGRTGKLWGHQNYGVSPDMMSLAKPLAGGLPIGAVLMTQKIADAMKPGDHGSTFAGNPLVCAAACTVFDIVSDPTFLDAVDKKGEMLREGLSAALAGNVHVKEVRGSGLICGIQLDQPAGAIVEKARGKGLLIITAGAGDVVRLVPPLIVTEAQIQHGVKVLSEIINEEV